uniref:Leucine-rich repeat-containing protein 51 n=1 Tax=Rhabditophanes sp. KR3021 TaxID=114890 RepID=A0AC35U846_9BILA
MSNEQLAKDFSETQKETLKTVASAARGVTQIMRRCEDAKSSSYLDLSDCSLLYLADAIYLVLKGYSVDKVSLQDNDLKKFPLKLVDKFPQLYFINIRRNKIELLPDELSKWELMKAANLADNKLKELPNCVFSWSQLTILDISNNMIDHIDIDRLFIACPKLSFFTIKGNPIPDHVIEAIKKFPRKVKNFKIDV